MSGKILSSDILDEKKIISALANVTKELENLDTIAKTVKGNLPAGDFKKTGTAANEAEKLVKKLAQTEEQINLVFSETNKKLAVSQSELQKRKKILKEAVDGEKAMAKAKRESAAAEKQQQAMTKLLIAAKQTEAGSISRVNAVNAIYRQRMKELNVLIPAQAKQYERLSQSIGNNNARMMTMAMGARQGAGGFNMLQFQIQQVARELPSIAYGANIFFAAISNNLPMLIDEIGRTRKEVALLQAQGKATVPVWKQVVGSIFSWQTAMVAAITVLTLYGQEIIQWIGGLFKAKKAIDAVKIAQDDLRDATKKATESSADEVTKLNILYNATQNLNLSLEDRQKAVDAIQGEYPGYLGNLTDEEILAGKAATAYLNLKEAIISKAKAQAYADKIAENYTKIAELEEKRTQAAANQHNAELELLKERAVSNLNIASTSITAAGSLDAFNATMEAPELIKVNKFKKEVESLDEEIQALIKSSELLEGKISIADFIAGLDKKEGNSGGNDSDNRLQIAKAKNERLIELAKYFLSVQASVDGESKHKEMERELELIHYKKELNNDLINYVDKGSKEYNEIMAESYKLDTEAFELELKYKKEIGEDWWEQYIRDTKRWHEERKAQDEDALAELYKQVNEEAVVLAKSATDQLNQRSNVAKHRRKTELELSQTILQLERDALQAKIDSGELLIENEQKIADRILEINENLEKGKRALAEENKEIILKTLDEIDNVASKGFDVFNQLNDNAKTRAEQRYEREMQLAGDSLDRQLTAKRKYEAEVRKIEKRQAIADKSKAAFKIIIDTASAVTEALPNIPLSIIMGILGAAQLAAVLAQPLPQFEKGGTVKEDSPIIAGERGRELMVLPGGKQMLTPDKPSILTGVPVGTEIIPNDETTRILAQTAVNKTYDMIDMKQTNSYLKDIRDKESVRYEGGYKIVQRKGFYGKYKVR